MIYNDFCGEKVSFLGLGCMRLPVIEGDDAKVNQDAVQEMVDYAISHGVNYFDTAWGYHFGNSEISIGKALSKYPRESFLLADKFPGYDVSNLDKVASIFQEQLKKCGVTYFDYYLFHNVCELNIEGYLNPEFGIYDYLINEKKKGTIKHLGFSVHGTLETLKRFMSRYGKDMEFCQIQLNYLDYHFQDARLKLEYLKEWNIPIIVMEPLRGGSLVHLGDSYVKKLNKINPTLNTVEWAFKYLKTVPEVALVLSGMSNLNQLKQNIDIFSSITPLDEIEVRALYEVASDMTSKNTVPCTSCRYCTSHCPLELNIPWLLGLYNEHVYSGGGFLAPMAINSLAEDKKPSACLGCRACEAVCPQKIEISSIMKTFNPKI